jgi:hypothetical protein
VFEYLMLLLMFLLGWSLSRYHCSRQWQSQLLQWKSQEKDWQLQLRRHSDLVVETEIQLVQEREQARLAMQKVMVRQSELEMALDLAHSKAMVTAKALEWDLQ